MHKCASKVVNTQGGKENNLIEHFPQGESTDPHLPCPCSSASGCFP